MTHFLVFESPKREKRRSAPVEAGSRDAAHLAARGWRVVQEYDEDVPSAVEQAGIRAARNARLVPPEISVNPEAAFEALPEDENVTVVEPSEAFSLMDVPGMTPEQAQALGTAGFPTVETLRDATDEDLRKAGLSNTTLRNLRKALQPK